ncbi:hypothetical protein HN587_03855 [Candidatus Woesearchaeota archaeon]|jgi:hypothetical protein|nr:hypothetical protein [Candidatus Woesearchaeota archaeon]
MIPVYQVTIQEYTFKKFRKSGGVVNYSGTPWFGLKIPKVYFNNKPDFDKIGSRIDVCLKRHFLGKKVAIRVLSSDEHPKMSIGDMIKIIKKLGHDRYDPNRVGDRYENIEGKHIDFFALEYKVTKKGEYFAQFIEPFYFWPIADGRGPIRVNLAIVYDFSKLDVVEHRYKGRENEIKKDGFVFKDRNDMSGAILGIIKIL